MRHSRRRRNLPRRSRRRRRVTPSVHAQAGRTIRHRSEQPEWLSPFFRYLNPRMKKCKRENRCIVATLFVLIILFSIPIIKEIRNEQRARKNSAIAGWGPLSGEHPQRDFNNDGIIDARRVNDTLIEIRTATGWERAEAPAFVIQRFRYEPIDKGTRRATFLIRANNGTLYKFRDGPDWEKTSFMDWPVSAAYGFNRR